MDPRKIWHRVYEKYQTFGQPLKWKWTKDNDKYEAENDYNDHIEGLKKLLASLNEGDKEMT